MMIWIFLLVDLVFTAAMIGYLIGRITQYYRLKRILGFESLPLTAPEKKSRR